MLTTHFCVPHPVARIMRGWEKNNNEVSMNTVKLLEAVKAASGSLRIKALSKCGSQTVGTLSVVDDEFVLYAMGSYQFNPDNYIEIYWPRKFGGEGLPKSGEYRNNTLWA